MRRYNEASRCINTLSRRSRHSLALPMDRKSNPLNLLISPQSLGLKYHIPEELLMSVCQLHEIQTALHSTNVINQRLDHHIGFSNSRLKRAQETMSNLKRAAEIFAQFSPGGKEHLAVIILLVDFLADAGFPNEAMHQLEKFSALTHSQKHDILNPFYLLMAQSKLAWCNGKFELALDYAQCASDQAVSVDGDDMIEKQTLALNALALSRMVQLDLTSNHTSSSLMKRVLDMEDILGTFQIASKISSNQHRMTLPLRHDPSKYFSSVVTTALSHCNQGVAEWLYIYCKNKKTLSTTHQDASISSHVLSIDPAMSIWRQAITYIEQWKKSSSTEKSVMIQDGNHSGSESNRNLLLIDMLLAKLYCNMAHVLLFSTIPNVPQSSTIQLNDLKSASEFASLAIKIYNKYITSDVFVSFELPILGKENSKGIHVQNFIQQDLARALTLAATCYAKSGSAVTSQGLFQSSIDILELGEYPWPLTGIDARSAILGYADLCKNWEKRETDYRLNMEKAEKIEEFLVSPWRQKPTIFSGVCFQY